MEAKNITLSKSAKAWFDKPSIGCASLEFQTIAGVDVFVVMFFGKRAHSVRTASFLSLDEAITSLNHAGYAIKAIV